MGLIRWSIPLGRLLGIRLELHLTFLILLAYVAWQGYRVGGAQGALGTSLLVIAGFGSVVLHELGHCSVAHAYGVPIRRILLLPIGGMAQFDRIPREPIREFLITAAGPAVNFIIVVALLPLIWEFDFERLIDARYDLAEIVPWLFVFNLIMGLFNLLPVFPMDGGRLLRALLATRFSYLTSTRIAVTVAKPLALAGVLLALIYQNNWIMAALFAFIYIGGELEYQMVRRREQFRDLFVSDVTRARTCLLPEDATLQDALRMMQLEQPTEILLTRGPRVTALLLPDELTKRIRHGASDDRLIDHAGRPPPMLQADWPLEVVGDFITRGDHAVYPVYRFETLVGVLDARTLDQTLRWIRLRQKAGERRDADGGPSLFDRPS